MDIFQPNLPTDSTIPTDSATSTLPGSGKDTSTLDEKQQLTTSSASKDNTMLYIAAGILAYFLFFKKK